MAGTYDLKEANDLIQDIVNTLVRAQPKNTVLAQMATECRMLMKANPASLHKLLHSLVIVPHSAKIAVADDSFIAELANKQGGDILGLGECYNGLALEDRAAVLFNLNRLAKLLPAQL